MVQILKLADKYFQVAITDMLGGIKENTPMNTESLSEKSKLQVSKYKHQYQDSV